MLKYIRNKVFEFHSSRQWRWKFQDCKKYAFLCNTRNTLVNKLLDVEKFQIRIDSGVVRAHLIVSQIAWKDPEFYGVREFIAVGTETRQQNQ